MGHSNNPSAYSRNGSRATISRSARWRRCRVVGLLAGILLGMGAFTSRSDAAPSGARPGASTTNATARESQAQGQVQRQYDSFDYEETAENMLKQVRVWIPRGLKTVRGILVVTNPAGGDTRDWHKQACYGEFLHLHDFAFLGAKGFTSHIESFQAMQHALQRIAKDAGRPELLNAPYVTTGFSAGGGFASRLVVEAPERVIAAAIVCSRLNLPDTPSPATLRTPACIISGELEDKLPPVIEPVLQAYRPQGALYGWMTVQGAAHAMVGQEVLAMPLLDAAVRLRYPEGADPRTGPVALKPLAPQDGWLADNASWKSGLVRIAPARQFQGAIATSSWLPGEDIAFIYRAYATYNRPLTITSPDFNSGRSRVWNPGSDVPIIVDDAKFRPWKKLEFYDGARKLGEITEGAPRLTAKNLTAGYHVFSVLGTDAQGNIRTSNPVLVIVGKLPDK
ncbi:MAG: hypothetical protein NTX50_19965 [Candidatus Sumerlaeota bacterium]|nr:hypothetical protein [Candidatus Sumerlaeota bacterium]